MGFKQKLCAFLLKAMGWTADSDAAPEEKVIILGVPHTSFMDFIVSYLFYSSKGRTAHVLIKKEMFWGPLGWLLRGLGCIPVDRTNGATFLKSLIETMEDADTFQIAICPEGTRKATRKWKMGYHTIAKATGSVVYLGYFNWGTRHIGIGEKFELTDDAKADTEAIKAHYARMNLQGRHKDRFIL